MSTKTIFCFYGFGLLSPYLFFALSPFFLSKSNVLVSDYYHVSAYRKDGCCVIWYKIFNLIKNCGFLAKDTSLSCLILFLFLAVPKVCGNSWARDQTLTTTVTMPGFNWLSHRGTPV